MSKPIHIPVLAAEVIEHFDPQPRQTFVDGTLGGGGHTKLFAERVGPDGLVIAMDRDPQALNAAEVNLKGLPVKLVHGNFCDLPEVLAEMQISFVDGIVLDLGISSDQLADDDRGFSFTAAGSLDLRMDPSQGEPAWRLIERLSAEHLANLIYEFGEERHSRRIARKVVERRRTTRIRTADQLADIVRSCVPTGKRKGFDPATRTFQALRIAVNDELAALDALLQDIEAGCRKIGEGGWLAQGARIAVISFHSLEDRRVKHSFVALEKSGLAKRLTRKPIRASEEEIASNQRSRPAKLRAVAVLQEEK